MTDKERKGEDLKVGIGVDFHRLARGESLILGGVRIDFEKGTVAHSDGDVIVHALCDALLGALGSGDIGEKFPDSDPLYKDVSSLKLLNKVMDEVSQCGYKVVNADVTLIAEEPKIGPYRSKMINRLADVLNATVSLKATTTEGLGFIGEGRGIGAQAIVALKPVEAN